MLARWEGFMRSGLACAVTLLLSVACAEAQTPAQTKRDEAVTGVNVVAPPVAPIPPTPALAPVHRGAVAGTVDSLPAAQTKKMREMNQIEEQNRVAAASPKLTPNPASLPLAQKRKPAVSRAPRTASKA